MKITVRPKDGPAYQVQDEQLTEHHARTILFNAANYLHANQMGDSTRLAAMDLMDDIRRDWANWRDLSAAYGVRYREHVVFRSQSINTSDAVFAAVTA